MEIDVAAMEFHEGGKAIWIHNNQGCTVLRIQCTGKIQVHKGCVNICAHADLNVIGNIDVCIPIPEPSPATASVLREIPDTGDDSLVNVRRLRAALETAKAERKAFMEYSHELRKERDAFRYKNDKLRADVTRMAAALRHAIGSGRLSNEREIECRDALEALSTTAE